LRRANHFYHTARTKTNWNKFLLTRAEQQIQRQHFAARGMPGAIAWHTPLGGARSHIEAKIFKGIGVRAGIPDVLALRAGRLFASELKADGGRLTTAQRETMEALDKQALPLRSFTASTTRWRVKSSDARRLSNHFWINLRPVELRGEAYFS
jgi:hypothetical protein